jgi:ribosomal protein S18 acetylase RimI-like enzyme
MADTPSMADGDIRRFREGDRGQIISLWARCDLTRPWNNPDADIDRKVSHGDGGLLVATRGDDVIGSVMAGYDGHRGWINYLAVDPSERQHRLGSRLMGAAEEHLRELGCPKINLQIRATNLDARSFYEHLGFLEDEVVGMGKRLIDDQSA